MSPMTEDTARALEIINPLAKKLNIPVIKSDTGGVNPRKIFFDPETFKVLMKYINNRHIDGNELEEKEKKYAIEIKTNPNNKIHAFFSFFIITRLELKIDE